MLTIAAALFAIGLAKQDMVVSTGWLASHTNDPLIQIVYVGELAEYRAGHIPGARFLARQDIVRDCDGLLNEIPPVEDLEATFTALGVGDWRRIVLVSNDPLLAARAWFTLDYIGHGYRTSVLDGGMARWRAENRPLSDAAVTVAAVPFSASEREYSRVDMVKVRDYVRRRNELTGKILLIDARPPQNFSGAAKSPAVPRPGHIPGAVNVPWTTNLTGGDAPVLRSPDELRALYKSAGVTDEAVVVTYCRTGMEASMTYFVLRYLGAEVTLYDGSFSQWSTSPDTMVARTDSTDLR